VRLRDLLPFRTFEIGTSWPPEVARVELKKSVDQGGLFSGGEGGDAPFSRAALPSICAEHALVHLW
jgi:hypothetical protein